MSSSRWVLGLGCVLDGMANLYTQSREKKQSKMEQSGLSEEELLRQQQELFRSATEKYNAGPE